MKNEEENKGIDNNGAETFQESEADAGHSVAPENGEEDINQILQTLAETVAVRLPTGFIRQETEQIESLANGAFMFFRRGVGAIYTCSAALWGFEGFGLPEAVASSGVGIYFRTQNFRTWIVMDIDAYRRLCNQWKINELDFQVYPAHR